MNGVPSEVVAGIAAGFGVLLLVLGYRALLRICRPNEILIFSGRKHKTEEKSANEGFEIARFWTRWRQNGIFRTLIFVTILV